MNNVLKMKGQTLFTWVFTILASLVLLFIIAPLAGMFLDSSFGELRTTAADPEVQRSVWYTLAIAFFATLFFAFGAVPLAWIMARKDFPLKKVVQGIIDLPVVLPHTAAGIALLGFISREGLLGGGSTESGYYTSKQRCRHRPGDGICQPSFSHQCCP